MACDIGLAGAPTAYDSEGQAYHRENGREATASTGMGIGAGAGQSPRAGLAPKEVQGSSGKRPMRREAAHSSHSQSGWSDSQPPFGLPPPYERLLEAHIGR